MTLNQYRDNRDNIIRDVDGVNCSLICNLDSDFNREEFLRIYEFYSETLVLHSDFGIQPAHLFFADRDTINAMAGVSSNGHYLVGINRGTINWLINNFKLNDNLISDSNILLFQKLEPFVDTSINNLMYQVGCHFTFYHEMAHLIQKSDYLSMNMKENPEPVDNFDINRHLLELDADTFSALCLGTHIMQYADRISGNNISKSIMEAFVVLFSIPIILYLLSFNGNRSAIYFKESTHPHPALRLTNFLMVLTGYVNDSLKGRNLKFRLKHTEMFSHAMDIAEELQDAFFNNSTVTEYKLVMNRNREDVLEYMKELLILHRSDTTSATNKWNLRSVQK